MDREGDCHETRNADLSVNHGGARPGYEAMDENEIPPKGTKTNHDFCTRNDKRDEPLHESNHQNDETPSADLTLPFPSIRPFP